MNKKKAVALISKALAAVAVVFVSTASVWVIYSPEIPEELQRKG